jgi:hypothetical protein
MMLLYLWYLGLMICCSSAFSLGRAPASFCVGSWQFGL